MPVNQKALLSTKEPLIQALCKKYQINASLTAEGSFLKQSIKSGAIDFLANEFEKSGRKIRAPHVRLDRNDYIRTGGTKFHDQHFDGDALVFLKKISRAMNRENVYRLDGLPDTAGDGRCVLIDIGQPRNPYQVI